MFWIHIKWFGSRIKENRSDSSTYHFETNFSQPLFVRSLSSAHLLHVCLNILFQKNSPLSIWARKWNFYPRFVSYPPCIMTGSHLLMTDIQRIRSCLRILFSRYQFAYMRIKHITGNIQMKWLIRHSPYTILSTHSVNGVNNSALNIEHCVCIFLHIRNISFYTNTSSHQFDILQYIFTFFFSLATHKPPQFQLSFFSWWVHEFCHSLTSAQKKKNSEL